MGARCVEKGQLRGRRRDRLLNLRGDREAIDPDLEPSLAANDLPVLDLPELEPIEHPTDRRLRVGPRHVDRSGNDQLVDGAGHRHVVQAQPLGVGRGLLGVPHLVVLERADALPGERVDHLEAEPPVREADDLLTPGRHALAAGVGDDDNLELEALRGVDGQEANRAGSLLLRHRLELLHPGGVLLGDEADEALDVGAAQLLVGAGQACELAQVRVAAAPVPPGEDREVVVVLDHDLLAEALEPDGARERGQPVVALAKSLEQTPVALGQSVWQALLDRRVQRPAGGISAQDDEGVVRDADERRGEHGDEGLVVVAVVQEPQVAEQVDHLLLAEITPSRRTVGRQVELAQRLLVLLGVGAGGEEQDDLARLGLAGVDELPHATGDSPRLAAPPRDTRVPVARLVRDQQLHGGARGRIGEAPSGYELLELVPEGRGEQLVDDGKHLRSRPPVLGQRQHLADLLAALLEHLHVGVAEAVDRLELVSDEEQLVARDQVDQLALQSVRVLELVDTDLAEAELLTLANGGVVAEQIARAELQVLEVERRLPVLRRLVRALERLEQALEQHAVPGGDGVQRGLLECFTRLLVVVVPLDRVAGEVEQRLGLRPPAEQLHEPGGLVGVAGDGDDTGRGLVDSGRIADRQLQSPSGRAKRLVDARQHPPEGCRPVGGEQREPVCLLIRTELGQRVVERLGPEDGRLALVQHAEPRVEPGRERVLLEQPQAEAVDGRDPRAVELAGQLAPAELCEPGPDARP